MATAETYVPGGALLPSADRAAWAFAEAFARLVKLASRPAEVSSLDPVPSQAAWDHADYDAKHQHAVRQRVVSLSEPEARERLRRAGTG